jgi:hypothetical protein
VENNEKNRFSAVGIAGLKRKINEKIIKNYLIFI